MLHTIMYYGPFTPNFDRLKKSKGQFRVQRPENKGYWFVDDPPEKVDGIVFAFMEKSVRAGDGEHDSFAVKVEDIFLDTPVRLNPDQHTDGKGFGPNGYTYFGDESAKRLLLDAIRMNPKHRVSLMAIYSQHFGKIPKRIERLLAKEKEATKHGNLYQGAMQQVVEQQEALEGEIYKVERTWRKRNRALITQRKVASDGHCEVCSFRFEHQYGLLNRDCLVAHHLDPIGQRQVASKTTLADIALLCPNCHAAVHTQDPPISLADLCKRLQRPHVKRARKPSF